MAKLSADYEPKQTKFMIGDEFAGAELSRYLTDEDQRGKTALTKIELKMAEFSTMYGPIQTKLMIVGLALAVSAPY